MSDVSAPAYLRLFIAVLVPEQVKAAIAAAQNQLRRVVRRSSVRWTSCEQFHLTLRFLGNVAAEKLEELEQKTRMACAQFAPLEMSAESIGFFPERGFPRVVWTGVQDREGRLPELQRVLHEATLDLNAEPLEGKFTGHVTLARFKEVWRPEVEKLREVAGTLAGVSFGIWTASAIDIMRSELSPAGATHSIVASLPLCGPQSQRSK